MAKTREEWTKLAAAKSSGLGFRADEVVAKVQNLLPASRGYWGEQMHMGLDKALRLEKKGVVQIVGVLGTDAEGNLVQGGDAR